MQDKFEQVAHYPALREDQRIAARQRARENLIAMLGGEPQFEDFERKQHSRFSPGMARFVNRAMWGLLSAAFVLSAIHIYFAASDAYGLGIKSPLLRAVGGVMFVVVAEIAAILFFTTPAVYEETINGLTRWLSYGAGIAASFVAIVFNIAVAIDYQDTPFDWLLAWLGSIATHPELFFVATIPPTFVLVVGQLQKTRILAENERRYAAARAYEEAMDQWKTILSTLENHPQWSQAWANALWDAWCFRKRREVLASITTDEKRAIVAREMEAEQWWIPGGFQMESVRNPAEREKAAMVTMSKSDEKSIKEQVRDALREHPELLKMPRVEAAQALGVSIGSFQRGYELYQRNGHSDNSADSAQDER